MTDPNEAQNYREMTVAQIREPTAEANVTVLFFESTRFYKLPRIHPAFNENLARLQQALSESRAIKVLCTQPHGDVIERVVK